ncbi:MAG: hypothetical protein RML12_01035 [Xanthomonadales bacterium]|nr:hypothetical protein [Xanthomonadales bacterium]
MSRLPLLLALLAAAPEAGIDAALRAYEQRLSALLALSPAELPTAAGAGARELLGLAAEIAPAFSAAEPQCRDYLEAALTVRERWPLLGPDSIEADYHRDGRLPKGAPALCYHMKDLIVHPATVLVLLAHPPADPAALRRELDEIGAHLKAVRALLGAPEAKPGGAE